MKDVGLVQQTVTPLFTTSRVFQWYDGYLYCLNFEKQCITMINVTTGTVQKEFGRKGKKAGEFQGLFSIGVDKHGVYGIDISQKSITEFTHHDTTVKVYKHPAQIMEATRLQEHSQYLVKPLESFENNKEEFCIVDIDAQSRQSLYISPQVPPPEVESMFAALVQPKMQSFYLSGTMVKTGMGQIFRVSTYAGEFLAFDETSGNVLFGRTTIDPTASTATLRAPREKITTDVQTIREINLSAAATSQFLFILSNAPSPLIKDFEKNHTDERVIDVYHVRNGDYAFSFVIPKHNDKRAKVLSITKEALWVMYDNAIVQYAYSIP